MGVLLLENEWCWTSLARTEVMVTSSCLFLLSRVLCLVYVLQLQVAIVEAVGYMAHLFEPDRLSQELGKIVSGYLAMYKKHSDHYFITMVGRLVQSGYILLYCTSHSKA